MAELKPCPFCGSSATLMHDHAGVGFSYVHCEKCGLSSVKFIKSFDRASDNDAVEYWNRRWEERENEILCVVRDYLCGLCEKHNSNTFGYEWTRKDGKIVELRVTIKDGCNRSMEQEG